MGRKNMSCETKLESLHPHNNFDMNEVPHRKLCTDCGISRTDNPSRCGTACQFIKPNYPMLEERIHGRKRALTGDELFFGPFKAIYKARLKAPKKGAQWTGITTELARQLLLHKKVDAILTMKPSDDDPWKPEPVLVTQPEDIDICRGMRMGYAPLLALLEPAIKAGHKRIAIIGIPCQIYALRAIEQTLGLEKLYVIGTPCSDNTTTANFHRFLALLDEQPDEITYLEFCADYHVELRYKNGRVRRIPFLQLPLADLPQDFFPLTCQSCVDYTNSLSDITVGYMGGTGDQWLIVRNECGQEILEGLEDLIELSHPESAGKRHKSVQGFLANVERAAGGLPLRKMPNWLRPIMGKLMPILGPKGQEFARTRVEMKAIESILHLRAKRPKSVKNMVPAHFWALVAPYGLKPQPEEIDNHHSE